MRGSFDVPLLSDYMGPPEPTNSKFDADIQHYDDIADNCEGEETIKTVSRRTIVSSFSFVICVTIVTLVTIVTFAILCPG